MIMQCKFPCELHDDKVKKQQFKHVPELTANSVMIRFSWFPW